MTTPAHDLPRSYWRTTVAAAGAGLLTAFNTNKTSWVGLALFVAVCLMAVFAPLIAPHDGRPGIVNVGENHRRAEKDVIFTDNACVDADIVLHLHVASEFDPWAYNDVLADIALLAEFSSGHDMTEVPDFAAGADLCRRVYDGGRMGKECSRRRVTSDE